MLATANPSFLFSPESHNFSPEDLQKMREAFMRACGDNPLVAATEAQRTALAKAIVSNYQRQLSLTELIAAALIKEN